MLELFGEDKSVICAKVNGKIKSLTYVIHKDSTIEPLTMRDRDAKLMYEASLRFIIAMAMKRIMPSEHIHFSYSISRSTFLTFMDSKLRFNRKIYKKLKKEVDLIVSQDIPLIGEKLPNEEVALIYEKEGYQDKIDALKFRPEPLSHIYTCDGYKNYMHAKMVPSTGYINQYNLILYEGGIIIQYPRPDCDGKIPEFENAKMFHRILIRELEQERITNADTVCKINQRIIQGGPVDAISLAEAIHYRQLSEIGNHIEKGKGKIKLICIAGPSSSGKTTFANRLRTDLLSRGYEPIRISLDDYYKIKAKDNGYDLESIDALDISLFIENMKSLINGDLTELPTYHFGNGNRTFDRKVQLKGNQPIIIEGIHALNDQISNAFKRSSIYKIFIAPTSQINLDNHNPLSLTDVRLLRRIVRDYKYRNTKPEETLLMWDNVRRGEFKWIYKTQEEADYIFNSLLFYELSAVKDIALPLLDEITTDSPCFLATERLKRLLKYFVSMPIDMIPCNSLMREFVGGSCYADV